LWQAPLRSSSFTFRSTNAVVNEARGRVAPCVGAWIVEKTADHFELQAHRIVAVKTRVSGSLRRRIRVALHGESLHGAVGERRVERAVRRPRRVPGVGARLGRHEYATGKLDVADARCARKRTVGAGGIGPRDGRAGHRLSGSDLCDEGHGRRGRNRPELPSYLHVGTLPRDPRLGESEKVAKIFEI
jgi:hypothetical protein